MAKVWYAEIRARIERRAKELGRSVRSILMEAQVARDLLYRDRGNSPRLDTLEKIAAAVGWNLAQVLGFDDNMGQVPKDIVSAAYRTTLRALRAIPHTDETVIEVLHIALNTLLQYRFEGRVIDENTMLLLEQTLAQVWGSAERARQSEARPPNVPITTRRSRRQRESEH